MSRQNKYSIGEFSSKTGVSIRTLHYYNELGLLQPEKNEESGHRIYYEKDIFSLHKIVSLKFLGYSLDKIKDLLDEASISADLNKTLALHLEGLEKEKEHIEHSMSAIKRVMNLLEKEGEVDSAVLFSLIRNTQVETDQKEWMEEHFLTGVAEELSKKSDEDKFTLDETLVQLSKDVKQLYGRPVEDMEVQAAVKRYIEASFAFLGEELIEKLAEADMEETEIQELEKMAPSPFTEEEQQWLNRAMEYYAQQAEKEQS